MYQQKGIRLIEITFFVESCRAKQGMNKSFSMSSTGIIFEVERLGRHAWTAGSKRQ